MKNKTQIFRIIALFAFIGIAVVTVYFIYLREQPLSKSEIYSLRPAKTFTDKNKVNFEDFAGSESCRECHKEQYDLWVNSTHGKAGGEPGNAKIIADFNNVKLRFKDATVIPARTKSGDYIFNVIREDQPVFTIKVDAVVGGGHMYGGNGQSFFTRFPDGTMRFLPFEYNGKDNTWFVQTQDSWVPVTGNIALSDLVNWPPNKYLGSQVRMATCQDCHGSQIIIEKDPFRTEYHTRYTTLRINCESCHGPGKKHIEAARNKNITEKDLDMEILAAQTKDQSLGVCFKCHAVKDVLQEGYLPGDNFEEFYSTKLAILTQDFYLPDGRVSSFAYQQNHLFSDCYINGSMTCVDCHSPHRNEEYRDIYGKKLVGKFDNGQCTGCHASKAENPELHSKHKKNSAGNLCTSCHMPFLQPKRVGNILTFARSDHIIPIPRPRFDNSLGIENACKKCHKDISDQDLQLKVNQWWGEIKPHNAMINDIVRASNVTNIERAADLLLKPQSSFTINQFNAMTIFARRFLKPDMSLISDKVIDKLKKLSQNKDTDIKAFAFACLHFSAGKQSQINKFLHEQIKKLSDNEQAVRLRWSQALFIFGHSYQAQNDLQNAILSFRKALEINPDDKMTWNVLGSVYGRMNNFNLAMQSFNSALSIDPYYSDAYMNLANVYFLRGDQNKGREMLRKVVETDPFNEQARQLLSGQ